MAVGVPRFGTILAVHIVAVEANPDPVNEKTEPTVPEVGVTVTLAVTLKIAHSPVGMSFAGVPLTVTFHLMSVVANGPTTKDPVAIPELREHAGEVSKRALGVLVGKGGVVTGHGPVDWYDNTTHPVSTDEKPVPLNDTVAPLVALPGYSTSVPPMLVTVNVA